MKKSGEGGYSSGQAALRAIIYVGILTFVLLFVTALALRHTLRIDKTPLPPQPGPQSPFDGARAFKDLEIVVGFGPRPSGSAALETCRGYIRTELEKAGLEVREFPFVANTPIGEKHMVNLVGVLPGARPGIIILGNHYETKYFPDFTFVGANDGGSSTAWMIEMARTLSASRGANPTRQGRTVWLCFFDGEEAFEQWTKSDSLYGSRRFVEYLHESSQLNEVHVMINVDMIGDTHLGIERDAGAPDWLRDAIWRKAEALGYGKHFLRRPTHIEDDHIPFREAGVPSIDLIDFVYGGSVLEHRRTWHTPNDTLERVSATSLQIVGDVVYHALPAIEAYLDGPGTS